MQCDRLPTVLLLLLAACAIGAAHADEPAAPGAPAEDHPTRAITLTLRPMPTFRLVTPGKSAAGSLFGLVGYAASETAAAKAGGEIVQQHQVEDPARMVGGALLHDLAEYDHLRIQDPNGVVTTADGFRKIARSYPGADLILDVRTIQWGAMGVPFDPSHYGIQLWVHVDLIEAKSAKLLVAADCSRQPERHKDSPSVEELLANCAQRLKDLSSDAAERCHAELRDRLFAKLH